MNAETVIVGGGPVGATLALTLLQKGRAVRMLEARAKGAAYQDQRALALSHGSRIILDRLGVWQRLGNAPTAINTIHVSQKGSFGRSLLKAQDYDLPALGYVLAYGDLTRALDEALAACDALDVTYEAQATALLPASPEARVDFLLHAQTQTIHSPLVVLADGGRSLGDIPGIVRETKAYGHDALISKVQCELPHNNIAYERFTPMGPMALLPNGTRDFSLVWTGRTEDIAPLLTMEATAFLDRLHAHFGDRVGRFLKVEKRMSFPLKLSYLSPVTAPHLVVIGNAAQTMHPVAGQGFNVGLRDAYELALFIAETSPQTLGEQAMLARYQAGRQRDTQRGLKFTDFLVNTFSNDLLGISEMRSLSLGVFDVLKPLKKHLVRKMSYGA